MVNEAKGSGGGFKQEIDILNENGIDGYKAIADALEKLGEEKKWNFAKSRDASIVDLRTLPVEDILTSELVQLGPMLGANPKYDLELKLRFALLGLTEEQGRKFIASDLGAMSRKDNGHRDLSAKGKVDQMELIYAMPRASSSVDHLTMSELIGLLDVADYARTYQHEYLPDQAMKDIGLVLSSDGPVAKESKKRMEEMGITKRQLDIFGKNESLILHRAKAGYKDVEKSWTPQSVIMPPPAAI
jgi:hypothetical protein